MADAAQESRETFCTNDGSDGAPSRGSQLLDKDTRSRKPVNGIEPFTKQERDEMEELLKNVRGHLGECHPLPPSSTSSHILEVMYPNRFLEGEDMAGNFMFNADRCVTSHTYISCCSQFPGCYLSRSITELSPHHQFHRPISHEESTMYTYYAHFYHMLSRFCHLFFSFKLFPYRRPSCLGIFLLCDLVYWQH